MKDTSMIGRTFQAKANYLLGLVMKQKLLNRGEAINYICSFLLRGKPQKRQFYRWLKGYLPWDVEFQLERLENAIIVVEPKDQELSASQIRFLDRLIQSVKRRGKMLVLVPLLMLLTGCGVFVPMSKSQGKLQRLDLNISTEKAQELLGKPDVVRAATAITNDLNYRIYQYVLYPKGAVINNLGCGLLLATMTWWIPENDCSNPEKYWLHFINGELRYWGKEGDFSGAPKEIVELRVKTGVQVDLK